MKALLPILFGLSLTAQALAFEVPAALGRCRFEHDVERSQLRVSRVDEAGVVEAKWWLENVEMSSGNGWVRFDGQPSSGLVQENVTFVLDRQSGVPKLASITLVSGSRRYAPFGCAAPAR